MPLVKGRAASSHKGFGENVKREMKEGKPQKQAVAIAYSEARRGKGEKEKVDHKKMHAHHMKEAEKHKKMMTKNKTPKVEPKRQSHAYGNGVKNVGSPHDINKGKNNEVYKRDKFR